MGSPWDVRITLCFLAESNMLRILARARDPGISFCRPLRYDAILSKVALLSVEFFNSRIRNLSFRNPGILLHLAILDLSWILFL
jgi:hypothetical protein